MAKKSKPAIQWNVADRLQVVTHQMQNLDPKDPSVWPIIPKALLCIAIAAVTTFVAWMVHLNGYEEQWQTARQEETRLREDYQKKMAKAVNLDALKKQREQVQLFVTQLEKQLPSKAEMAALLSDINQAGVGRSLQFELFRPGGVIVRDYYAELPIAVKVSGDYHDMGAFASDIAHLSRIVTLNNISIAPVAAGANKSAASGSLVMDATARTFRYLDAEEISSQKSATKSKAK